jgi:hypothetical protein
LFFPLLAFCQFWLFFFHPLSSTFIHSLGVWKGVGTWNLTVCVRAHSGRFFFGSLLGGGKINSCQAPIRHFPTYLFI